MNLRSVLVLGAFAFSFAITGPTLADPQDEQSFWATVEKANRGKPVHDLDARTATLLTIVNSMSASEREAFGRGFQTLLGEAYTWDLAVVESFVSRHCRFYTDEAFVSWVMLQGPDIFRAAVEDGDTIASLFSRSRCPKSDVLARLFRSTISGVSTSVPFPDDRHGRETPREEIAERFRGTVSWHTAFKLAE